ncbi:glycosyltransferase [Flavobacterium tegetincola]|uniref:glycosyltransferase n=1 Tax=Flavobacterium tegetincola TaxID=150172 RepID=UPI0003F5722F|nr:glycosyltransferase [Flavobacterium tegetincola]
MVEKTPILSICCITFNQEKYVEDTIRGFLFQKTDFPFEIIIHDDASTDNTIKIIQSYAEKFPNLIKTIIQKENQHSQGVRVLPNFVYPLARGKYIALCEGDDYWTDPLKLQKQLDYLEKNAEHTMCFHSVTIDNKMLNSIYPEKVAEGRDYSIDELLLTKTAHTASFVFRKQFLNIEQFLNKDIFAGDVFLALMMADSGKVYGMADDMAVYRIHEMGISNFDAKRLGIIHQERFVKQFILIKNTFKTLSDKAINLKIVDHCLTIVKYYTKKKSPIAIYYLGLAIYYRPDLILKGFKKLVK